MLTRMLALRLPRPARAFSSATTDDAGRREDAESFSETSSRGNPADAALLQKILRRALVAEGTAASLFAGRACAGPRRPDVQAFAEKEEAHLKALRDLAPRYHVRPSLLAPAASAAGFALGALSSVLPSRLSAAVSAGLQEAYTEQYTDDLRRLRQAGPSAAAAPVREAVLALRDEERAPEGAPTVPYVAEMQRILDGSVSKEEVLAGAVKLGASALLRAAGAV